MKQQSATEIDLDVFDGNPLNFHYSMTVFREAVEKKIEDPCGRFIQLIKSTTGEVKDLIKNYIQLPAKEVCETITEMQTWNVLDTPELMCMLLSKLPSGTRNKWSRKVLGVRRKLKKDPELVDLIDFVSDENLIVNDPSFQRKLLSFKLKRNQ